MIGRRKPESIEDKTIIGGNVPGHEADRYDLSQPPPRPTIAMLQGHPPAPICPAASLAEAASTGMISVGGFLNSSRTLPGARVDDAPAVRAAIAAAENCSAAVFFPPGSYSFHTTVSLPSNLELRGSGLPAPSPPASWPPPR